MQLIRWDPFQEMEEVTDRLNRLFSRPTVGTRTANAMLTPPDWSPSVDIIESSKEYMLMVELPNVNEADVTVWVDRGILRIQGERKQEKEHNWKKYYRMERYCGFFSRSFTIFANVKEDRVFTEFREGVLNVRFPKGEKVKPKTV